MEAALGPRDRLEIAHPIGRAGGLLGWLFICRSPGRRHPLRPGGRTRLRPEHALPGADWGRPEDSRLALPLGASGHLWSGHRHDQQQDWLKGDPEGRRTRLRQAAAGTELRFSPR